MADDKSPSPVKALNKAFMVSGFLYKQQTGEGKENGEKKKKKEEKI